MKVWCHSSNVNACWILSMHTDILMCENFTYHFSYWCVTVTLPVSVHACEWIKLVCVQHSPILLNLLLYITTVKCSELLSVI